MNDVISRAAGFGDCVARFLGLSFRVLVGGHARMKCSVRVTGNVKCTPEDAQQKSLTMFWANGQPYRDTNWWCILYTIYTTFFQKMHNRNPWQCSAQTATVSWYKLVVYTIYSVYYFLPKDAQQKSLTMFCTNGNRIVIQIGGAYYIQYILPSARGRAYFCRSISIEMGGVSRDFSKASGSGTDLALLTLAWPTECSQRAPFQGAARLKYNRRPCHPPTPPQLVESEPEKRPHRHYHCLQPPRHSAEPETENPRNAIFKSPK